MSMHFDEDGYPVIGENGKVPAKVSIPSTRPDYVYCPLNGMMISVSAGCTWAGTFKAVLAV